MKVLEFLQKVKQNEINIEDYLSEIVQKVRKINDEYHYFNSIVENPKPEHKGKLFGLPVSVKDLIITKGIETTASSDILKGFIPKYDATVVERLKNAGAVIIGKTVCDAFGFGSFNLNIGKSFQPPLNPIDKKHVTGGSSGGAGGITQKADFTHVAIATSTGGSIECPSAFCGVYGFCPTYGLVSRYGLISYADSLDKIGIIAKYIEDIKPVLKIIAGHDEKDNTSLSQQVKTKEVECLKVGIVTQALEIVNEEIRKAVEGCIKKIEKHAEIVEVSLQKAMKYGVATYYIIATAEASTNLARYCGLRFGRNEKIESKHFREYFAEIRGKYFSEEEKRRILLGTFVRMAGFKQRYYVKATKIRKLVIEEYKQAFNKADIILTPTMAIFPPKIDEVEKMDIIDIYNSDLLTIPPNLAGVPHITIPVQTNKKFPTSIMLCSNHLTDYWLIDIATKIDKWIK